MLIAGTGISSFTCKTLPGFQILQRPAIKWVQVESGNWLATDRGAASDVYEARISIYGIESVIDNFINQVYAGRVNGNNQITLSSFFSDEKIFGENVNYSGTISATILEMPEKQQGSLKGFGLADIYIRAITPTFSGSSSWPSLVNFEPGGELDSSYTIKKMDSYTAALTYIDHRSDIGIFSGVFTLTLADKILALNYIRNQRSGNFTLADTFGVDAPFGTRTSNSYPYTVKLIEWEDLGYFGLKYGKLRLRFAEVV